MERSIKECVKIAGNENYAKRIDTIRQYVQKIVDNSLIDKDVRMVMEDAAWVLETLSEDIRKGRVGQPPFSTMSQASLVILSH